MNGQWIKACACILLLCVSTTSQTFAQNSSDKELIGKQSHILPDLDFHYNEDFCDFEIKFPTEPNIKDITSVGGEGLKATAISYIKVFDLDKSLRVSANCKQLNKAVRNVITEETINKDLKDIEEQKNLIITNKTNKGYPDRRLRIATLVGQRKATPGIGVYVYQIWVADRSIFSLEVEVKGPEYDELDKMFVAILNSFKHKETKEP